MKIHHHFSRIAHKYEDLRTTDLEPILFIKDKFQNLSEIEAADVGCGGGRYDLELFHHLGDKLHLTCIDYNRSMLNELIQNLKEHKIKNFKAIKALADDLPLADNSLDCMFTFNTIHHFKLLDFLKEASRVLRDNGYLFIYTRLRSQNKRNIWGKYFSKFNEKETRLYELNELEEILNETTLRLESVEYFKYKRIVELEWLVAQAKNHHYSTFYLYDEKEFEESLKEFQENIARQFKKLDRITWNDENIMLVLEK
ncbi:class I SAM-dependent methyltransferase [candidate division WOR-3 bacterium]|nr:class I SAM-dependent methyltransferase [candidate division WOR-3 bacterium]